MPLDASDFVPPGGELKEQMFPDRDNLANAIQGWIQTANTKLASDFSGAVPDEAVEAFVYWKAYWDVYLRMSAEPQSLGVSETLNYQYVQAQAERFKDMALEWKDKLEEIRAPETAQEDDTGPTSGSVNASVSW